MLHVTYEKGNKNSLTFFPSHKMLALERRNVISENVKNTAHKRGIKRKFYKIVIYMFEISEQLETHIFHSYMSEN